MRSEVQPANSLRVAAEIVEGGVTTTGLSLTCDILRISDSKFWHGSSWVVGSSPQAMTENPTFPGLYAYSIAAADLDGADYAAAFPGYLVRVAETTLPFVEHIRIVPMIDPAQATLANGLTVYDALKRLVSLRQDNVRIVYDTWLADGKPTHGMVYVYDDEATATADTDPFNDATGSYEWTANYDPSTFKLLDYLSVRVS